LIPVDRVGNALTVAMADPSNIQAIEDIEMLTQCVIQTFVSTPSDILKAIERYYKHGTNTKPSPEPNAS
jgi:type IV pilus assembly protein PilB